MTVELIIRGKEALAEGDVLRALWNSLGEPLFDILRHSNYPDERGLLNILSGWAQGPNAPFLSIPHRDTVVNAGVFFTHQAHIRAAGGEREFGDVTFTTSFSSKKTEKRVTYANTFQIKVDDTTSGAYRELFRGRNLNQLDFYRRNLILDIGGPYPEICDFLYYWLIGRQTPHPLVEVPLSLTWLGRDPPFKWPRYPLRYLDTMYKCLFLITGINVDSILRFCAPGLRKTLEDIAKNGVCPLPKNKTNNPINDYPEKPPTEFKPPKYPLSSALVIATEVEFLE